jgi:hypothetical protein
MDKKSGKLQLSKETLLSLEDQDLAGVVGGQLLTVGIDTVVCNSGICNSGVVCDSAVCNSVVCGLDSTVCL